MYFVMVEQSAPEAICVNPLEIVFDLKSCDKERNQQAPFPISILLTKSKLNGANVKVPCFELCCDVEETAPNMALSLKTQVTLSSAKQCCSVEF